MERGKIKKTRKGGAGPEDWLDGILMISLLCPLPQAVGLNRLYINASYLSSPGLYTLRKCPLS
jgi:hypothetical protein